MFIIAIASYFCFTLSLTILISWLYRKNFPSLHGYKTSRQTLLRLIEKLPLETDVNSTVIRLKHH
jgi:hypothetical protein